jgi:hypothetical protein
VHTHDATDRNAIAKRRGGKDRQRYRRAHELGALDVGDTFELGNATCFNGTEPEWPICGDHRHLSQHRQHHGRRHYRRRYGFDEGEVALTR